MSETVIRADDGLLTVINVFEVEADKQKELVEALNEAADKAFRHQPGFVSANIFVSGDGGKVVNLAQWRSAEDVKASLGNETVQEHTKKLMALGKAAPGMYSVASVFHAS